MGIKIKNLQTGEFEKFNIPALKGEKGEPGEIEPSEKVDYIGKQHSKLRDTMNANVDYIIKTAIGEFNYLDYEGQHITATNTLEGHAKSAILKGQTLVNLTAQGIKKTGNVTNFTQENGYMKWNSTQTWQKVYYAIQGKPNTNYMVRVKAKHEQVGIYVRHNSTTASGGGAELLISHTVTGEQYKVFTSSDTGVFSISLETEAALTDVWVQDFMILEYQDGMENWDIPYFEGMASCKMPVLTSSGKNLFDGEIEEGIINSDTGEPQTYDGRSRSKNFIRVPKNTDLYINVENGGSTSWTTIYGYDENKKYLDCIIHSATANKTFNTGNASYIKWKNNAPMDTLGNIQIEQGSTATPYEPYKSNILSTPEEVVLREVNGVRDTLNLMTGEYIQRIGEVVLDGTSILALNKWEFGSDCTEFNFNAKGIKGDGVTLSNFAKSYLKSNRPRNTETVSSNNLDNTYVLITIQKSKLATDSVEGMNQYLQSNPIIIQYELKTPVIKTVDLSDNVVYSYGSTTHYSCSSAESSLVPTLSVKVPTDTQLTIQEQKATTQTLLIKNMDLQQSIKEVQAMNLAFNTALYNSFNSIREEVEDIKKHVSTNENLEGSF